MSRPDNYAIMADNTRRLFLTYDQSAIIASIPLTYDPDFFYLPVLDRTCRIDRKTGRIFWPSSDGSWVISTLHNDAITIFDYLCDASPSRTLSGEYRALAGFGHMFHTGLVEDAAPTELERFIDANPDTFRAACESLGGQPYPRGDIAYILPFFPDLPVVLQFWHSDEDFPPQLRSFWDTNSLSWLRYETMYYALGLLRSRLAQIMNLHN